jgi:peroxiredoxin
VSHGVFVIGPDGEIVARFDNVASEAEIEAALQRLPTT